MTDSTLDRHNKLYYLEFDHITHTAPGAVDDCKIPGARSRLRTERETIDVMRRDYMMCTTRGAALWWFDMFEGWFYGDNVMESVAQIVEISKIISQLEQENASEVLVVVSPEALYHVNKNADINTEMLSNLRGELNSFGLFMT